MNELALQTFLRDHPDNWYELLKSEPYELLINEKDDRVIFKYMQVKSDFSQQLVRESRGIILEKDSWNIVCLPFNKFFNFGESHADAIDLNNSVIFEKVDGSIIKVYCYNGVWRVATNGTIDAADATTYDDHTTFEDLFFDVISPNIFENFVRALDKNCTYLFELIHPMNRVVVDYEGKKELVFLGMRNNLTLEDYMPRFPATLFPHMIRKAKIFHLNIRDLSELADLADKINESGASFEGFIVAETDGDKIVARNKIKSPKYLILHRLADRGTNSVLEMLLEHDEEEFEAYIEQIPDHIKVEYYETKRKFYEFLAALDGWFKEYKELSEQVERKELALAILGSSAKPFSGLIFTHVDKGGSPIDILNNNLNPVKRLKGYMEAWK